MSKKHTKVIDITWVEDNKQYLPSVEDELTDIQKVNNIKFEITPKSDSREFKKVAENIPSSLVFCIDYNLHNGGDGINGDEVIRNIREVNKDCVIIFYSFKLTQEELRKLVNAEDKNTYCVHRTNLMAKLRELIEDGLL